MSTSRSSRSDRRMSGCVQSAVLWSTNLLITLTLLSMINGIGVGPTMWVYAAFNVFAFVFVLRRMPELTGRSSSKIEGSLSAGRDTSVRTTSRSTGQ